MSGAVLVVMGGVAGGVSASVNRSALSGFSYAPGTAQTSKSVVCTASGGTPPYTYAWTQVGSTDIYATASTSATTYFGVFSASPTDVEDSFVCTVTDSAAASADSVPVTIELTLRDSDDPFTI